jgi:hypothetical protein
MRKVLLDQTLRLKIDNQVGTNTRPRWPAKCITDIDFADDIMLISHNDMMFTSYNKCSKAARFSRYYGLSSRFIY